MFHELIRTTIFNLRQYDSHLKKHIPKTYCVFQ